MRLIAVPLALVRPSAHPVCTFLAQRSPNILTHKINSAASTSSTTPPTQPLTTRLLNKASNFWIGLGKDGQDGKSVAFLDWKRRTYKTGEKLMDRIEYEEWALKAVDPTLGPSVGADGQEDAKIDKQAKGTELPPHLAKIPIHFPPSIVSPRHLLNTLKTLTASRTPHHRRSLILCVVGMPFTIPFMLLPVVPNLPFFYLVWRAWSHWRAFSSSKYLSALLSQNRILPRPDKTLDPIFTSSHFEPIKEVSTFTSASHNNTTSGSINKTEPLLLLSTKQIELLGQRLDLNQQSLNELSRARQQTLISVRKGDLEKIERAAEGFKDEED